MALRGVRSSWGHVGEKRALGPAGSFRLLHGRIELDLEDSGPCRLVRMRLHGLTVGGYAGNVLAIPGGTHGELEGFHFGGERMPDVLSG